MLSLSQLPIEFRGTLYNEMMQNDSDSDIMFPKILTLGPLYENFGDILRQIDTCCFLGCKLPHAVYSYIDRHDCLDEIVMFKNGKLYPEYEFFQRTEEFHAVEMYARNFTHYERTQQNNTWILKTVAQTNSVLILQYLEETENIHYILDDDMQCVLLHACRCGSNDILKYWNQNPLITQFIQDKGVAHQLLAEAAVRGHVNTLKCLREIFRLELSIETVNACLLELHNQNHTIQQKRIECLKYAVENGCPYDDWTLSLFQTKKQLV